MKLVVSPAKRLEGKVTIPASKSHTIRAVVIASLAEGKSTIINPLSSADTIAAVNACKALGAKIEMGKDWIVTGFGKDPKKDVKIDFMNSGTSSRLLTGVMAAIGVSANLDGDKSLRSRPMFPLLDALISLGIKVEYLGKKGFLPVKISGNIKGDKVKVDGKSSQYVSSLLLSCPLVEEDIEVDVINIHEVPYIEMTLRWMDEQGIKYEKNNDFTKFKVHGGQSYRPFKKQVPSDWSSATFPLCAASIVESDVVLEGLDFEDTQGDKEVVNMLKKMGASIKVEKDKVKIKSDGRLVGKELDLNNTPDALPALSVVGCCASGTTTLKNVAQARIKETDRIKVMHEQLSKMGADIREMEDGLVVKKSKLNGLDLRGYEDHRIVMALSLAGMVASGRTTIDTAESIKVTFPSYVDIMKGLGADIKFER